MPFVEAEMSWALLLRTLITGFMHIAVQVTLNLLPFFREDFVNYAETCFRAFGDRVKRWITFNEPHTFAVQGYDAGLFAPGRCSVLLHLLCRGGNSATEPYVVAHNILLAHAAATDVYRRKYQVQFVLLGPSWTCSFSVWNWSLIWSRTWSGIAGNTARISWHVIWCYLVWASDE